MQSYPKRSESSLKCLPQRFSKYRRHVIKFVQILWQYHFMDWTKHTVSRKGHVQAIFISFTVLRKFWKAQDKILNECKIRDNSCWVFARNSYNMNQQEIIVPLWPSLESIVFFTFFLNILPFLIAGKLLSEKLMFRNIFNW